MLRNVVVGYLALHHGMLETAFDAVSRSDERCVKLWTVKDSPPVDRYFRCVTWVQMCQSRRSLHPCQNTSLMMRSVASTTQSTKLASLLLVPHETEHHVKEGKTGSRKACTYSPRTIRLSILFCSIDWLLMITSAWLAERRIYRDFSL